MKKHIIILFMAISFSKANAQANLWDVPLTEELISHNKKNYSDHQEARDNQAISFTTVNTWKKAKEDFKELVDKIDQRLTQVFIVAADITTIYNTSISLKEILQCQEQAFQFLFKHPFAIDMFYQREIDLVKSAIDLYGFTYLIIMSYGDISKMQVSDRQNVFRAMSSLLEVLKAKAFSLLQRLRQIDFAELYKQTPIFQFINKDREAVQDILKNFKH